MHPHPTGKAPPHVGNSWPSASSLALELWLIPSGPSSKACTSGHVARSHNVFILRTCNDVSVPLPNTLEGSAKLVKGNHPACSWCANGRSNPLLAASHPCMSNPRACSPCVSVAIVALSLRPNRCSHYERDDPLRSPLEHVRVVITDASWSDCVQRCKRTGISFLRQQADFRGEPSRQAARTLRVASFRSLTCRRLRSVENRVLVV
jgi:hypothetical protein